MPSFTRLALPYLLLAILGCDTEDLGPVESESGGSTSSGVCLDGTERSCEPLCSGKQTCVDGAWTLCSPCTVDALDPDPTSGGGPAGGEGGTAGAAPGGTVSAGGVAGGSVVTVIGGAGGAQR